MNLYGFKPNPIKNSQQLLTFTSGAAAITYPTTLYLAFNVGGPVLRTGVFGSTNEMIGTNYQRVAVACTATNWTVNATGQVVNANQITLRVPGLVLNNTTVTATTAGANSNVITFSNSFLPTGADAYNAGYGSGNFVVTGGTNINAGTYTVASVSGQTWTLNANPGNLTTGAGAGSAIVGYMNATWNKVSAVVLIDSPTIGSGKVWYAANCTPVIYSQTSAPYIAAGALIIQE